MTDELLEDYKDRMMGYTLYFKGTDPMTIVPDSLELSNTLLERIATALERWVELSEETFENQELLF